MLGFTSLGFALVWPGSTRADEVPRSNVSIHQTSELYSELDNQRRTDQAIEENSITIGSVTIGVDWDDSEAEIDETLFNDVVMEDVVELAIDKSKLVGPSLGFGDWLGYNTATSDTTWIAAQDDLGIFSVQSYPTISIGETSSFDIGMGFHFLSGPTTTDMPPRLFDFEMALRTRRLLASNFMADLKLGVGAFSDFEGSARKGIRFPGHAVGYYELDPWLITVLGVDVLDRDDISLLPVAGIIWRPVEDIVCEMVFPRPKIQYRLNASKAFYIGGELGGGTWAIERVGGTNDVATYSDLRVTCGVMNWGEKDDSVLEIGYAFERSLEYRSGVGNYDPSGALILRVRSHF